MKTPKEKELETRAALGPRFPRSKIHRPPMTAEPRPPHHTRASGGNARAHPTRDSQ